MSKYLTYDQRLEIEAGLKENLSFGAIAKKINKDRTTVAKEIKRNFIIKKIGCSGWPYNSCKHREKCNKLKVCDECKYPSKQYCKLCKLCNDGCAYFDEEVCINKFKPPYVCNACKDFQKCTLAKPFYSAIDAHHAFSENISEARSGIISNETEIARINELITPLIRNGQSIHQIYVNNVDELMCSEKTLYNYVDACLFDVRNIDLPRKVKYRPRYKKSEFKVDKGCRIGRNYTNFTEFISKNPESPIVQMDSVIGASGGKVLLTLHFVETSFMLAFLREANTSKSVIDVFDYLYKTLGRNTYEKLFPIILTDNGSEFSNPKAIEYGPDGILRSRVFYCDSSAPYQKGAIEVNHSLIRRILPKGKSFDVLTQNDIILAMNHVNSYKRKKLNDKSPYDAFSFYYGEDILGKLGYAPVAADSIILAPKLLKSNL
ncbi:IS30 family transposase [Clostridium sp. MSJ-11]|uniref:IS30 family transposase n=1 Tax=Clostridium mobile TaxID=2841512 RepID=A0ABS6EFI2_9CLOT|nr:IS30 family transposase [Clostridium mobile]MBU5483959.1 IS30 family transposase [Clostridium mobile]